MWMVLGTASIEFVGPLCIQNFRQTWTQKRCACVIRNQIQERNDGGTTLEFEDDIQYLRSLDPRDWKVCVYY